MGTENDDEEKIDSRKTFFGLSNYQKNKVIMQKWQFRLKVPMIPPSAAPLDVRYDHVSQVLKWEGGGPREDARAPRAAYVQWLDGTYGWTKDVHGLEEENLERSRHAMLRGDRQGSWGSGFSSLSSVCAHQIACQTKKREREKGGGGDHPPAGSSDEVLQRVCFDVGHQQVHVYVVRGVLYSHFESVSRYLSSHRAELQCLAIAELCATSVQPRFAQAVKILYQRFHVKGLSYEKEELVVMEMLEAYAAIPEVSDLVALAVRWGLWEDRQRASVVQLCVDKIVDKTKESLLNGGDAGSDENRASKYGKLQAKVLAYVRHYGALPSSKDIMSM